MNVFEYCFYKEYKRPFSIYIDDGLTFINWASKDRNKKN